MKNDYKKIETYSKSKDIFARKKPASQIKTPQLIRAYFISGCVVYPGTKHAIVKFTSKENRMAKSLSR